MNNNKIETSRKIFTKKVTINNNDYYAPYQYNMKELKDIVKVSKPQKYIMKIMIVDDKQYYVPYHWIDSKHTRNIIKNSVKSFPYPLQFP